MKKGIISVFTFMSLLIVGCSSSTDTSSSSVSSEQESVIITNQDSFKLLAGKSGIATVRELPADAKGKEVEWSVLEGKEYFKVFDNGELQGIKEGSGTLQVKVKGTNYKKEMPVTVIKQSSEASEAFPVIVNNSYSYNTFKLVTTPKRGNQNILVIPIKLYGCEDNLETSNLATISKAYNSMDKNDGWTSLREYYLNASYSELNMEAVVADQWFNLPSEYTEDALASGGSVNANSIPQLAIKWYQETYPSVDMSKFDMDNDHIIDNIHLVHNSNNFTGGLWTYMSHASYDTEQGEYRPEGFTMTSIAMLKDSFYSSSKDGLGTKLIIHENGHMLGLYDYYDTYTTRMDVSGKFDMQSGNYFDWNAFSKYSTGWGTTHYVDNNYIKEHKKATITLSSSALDGEFLLLKNESWNGMPFDEYILLELFNINAGNNYFDSYADIMEELGPVTYGVKIYHVDARVVQTYMDQGEYKNEVLDEHNYSRVDYDQRVIMNTNSSVENRKHETSFARKIDEESYNYYLLHLLQKGNANTFAVEDHITRNTFNDSDLWRTGDTFTIGEHPGYTDYGKSFFYKKDKFNDNSSFPYGITFDEVTADTATITVNYLG